MLINQNKKDSYLKILSWNAQGLQNKHLELEHLINTEQIDIALIQESKLNNKKPPKIKNFISLNKPNGSHLGLIIYYHKNLDVTELITNTKDSDTQGIKFKNMHIFNFYNTFTSKINCMELNSLLSHNNKTVIIGDFNSKHRNWNCYKNDVNGNKLNNFINNNNILHHYPQNNHTHIPSNGNRASTIDFALSKNIHISKIETLNALDSDHLPVEITIQTVNNYHYNDSNFKSQKTDWKKFKAIINDSLSIDNKIPTVAKIDEQVTKITNSITEAFNKSTTIQLHNKNSQTLPQEILDVIKNRNKLRKQYQRQPSTNLHQYIKSLNKEIHIRIQSHKQTTFANKIRTLTIKNKTIWPFVKNLKRSQNINTKIHKLHTRNGIVYDDTDKANAIADTYFDNHNLTDHYSDNNTINLVNRTYNQFNNTVTSINESHLTSPSEIKKIINRIKAKKAPGHDKINNLTLKNLPRKAIIQLYYIFNSCIKLNYFPNTWKEAIVLPFLKPGKDKLFPINYRPISLLPTLGKILELLILSRLKTFEKSNKTLIPEQFGFRAKHSTTLQLARITDTITKNYNTNKSTALLTLDIEKAFDTVWHKGLIYKLIQNNIPNTLIKIIISFLKNRTFAVKINNTLSNKQKLPAGVPQGAILSPILFNYYVNDIPKHNQTQIALFADDTALIAQSTKKQQANIYLQKHIDQLEDYYDKWKIKVNPTKTKLVHFSVKRDTPNNKIKFNNIEVNHEKSLKYLGVILDQRLTFESHIREINKKAKAAINVLYPILNKHSPMDTKFKLLIYKQYIRPIMLYSCPIFSKASKTNLNKLQVTQNKALRLILNKHAKITDLHKEAQMETIPNIIHRHTDKFFNYNCKNINITNQIGSINHNNSPYTIKHKLINHILID